ncbi:tRNA (34-2'-O)-methyltransferase regulator WDR6 [Diabrotica undecimpunctata]|uniref:tRNA (34-2'-O)-methyltransferase regulator WDR6 n=1 Tax=Diabrotica undecimpunctata TaxID=50387 RepID=UPI003B63891E
MQNKLQIWDNALNFLETFECQEKCILYSAHICYNEYDKLVLLSGTVFNEVLIWKVKRNEFTNVPVFKRLKKHDGVIFCIHYNEDNGIICSTSDDRSAILWKVENTNLSLELNREHPNIFPICQVYGHLSRVFRCLVLKDCFITAGEDSLINIWKLDGKLARKVEANQNSPIWALDFDEKDNVVLSGGGNGGVYAFSLINDIKEEKICLPNSEKPKIVGILLSGNFVVFSECGVLYFYNNRSWVSVKTFEDLKSYVVMKVSKCKKLIALAGFIGQIYIYKENQNTLEQLCYFQSNIKSRIISLHWLTCDMILICQDGGKLKLLYLKPSEISQVCSFTLPKSSQRISTTAIIFEDTIVVGDRKGSLHRFKIGQRSPIQTVSRVQSHLGVTNLITQNNRLISLGRNSTIKTFLTDKSGLSLATSDKLPYSWLLDIVDDLVIAFSGNNFVVWNYKTKRLISETICGGGHRSWDFSKTDVITFLYIKDKFINKLEYNLIVNRSHDIIEPFHLNDVNSMQIISTKFQYIIISGGEDTTIRITVTDEHLSSFVNKITLKSHLSSIRCITTLYLEPTQHLLFSAGGRAQIVSWTLTFSIENNIIHDIICKENDSYYEVIDNEESETRIMDLCAMTFLEQKFLFAACSDGYIKCFSVTDSFKLTLYRNVFYKLKCIFKIITIKVLCCDVLVTMASDGCVVFWQTADFLSGVEDVVPFGSLSIHASGINTVSTFRFAADSFLFLTAGDDNIVMLSYLKFSGNKEAGLTVEIVDQYKSPGVHWAQITGTFINDQFFITASVDQRILLYTWQLKDEHLECKLLTKYNTSVSDLKGIICFDDNDKKFDLFVYGLGVEFLKLVNK